MDNNLQQAQPISIQQEQPEPEPEPHPQLRPRRTQTNNSQLLGHREIDKTFQFKTIEDVGFSGAEFREYLAAYKTSADTVSREEDHVIEMSTLSSAQRQVINIFKSQIRRKIYLKKRIIVQGKAGTGKSAVIKCMREILERKNMKCIIMAPTGAAAVNIDGKTIHSILRLPVKGAFIPLVGEPLETFRAQFINVKFIIIDEYSMVGSRLLGQIHFRLCQVRGNMDIPFGGFFIYFFGDIRQLPPVQDTPIYMPPCYDELSQVGDRLKYSFQKKIVLTECFRHTSINCGFREILDKIATGSITEAVWRMLMQRREDLVIDDDDNDNDNFKSATRLFPTNKMVERYNTSTLAASQLPVIIIASENNNSRATQGSENLAEGLARILYLSIGCRIMLRRNICVEKGLVNGSIGIVREILYAIDQGPPKLPLVLMIEFEKFTGPFIRGRSFPLMPITSTWVDRGINCQRRQFPISLAYALTIHKSQGLTIDKAVVDIGPKESSPGLTYVALGRVRSLADLILKPFKFERLLQIAQHEEIVKREKFIVEFGISNK